MNLYWPSTIKKPGNERKFWKCLAKGWLNDGQYNTTVIITF